MARWFSKYPSPPVDCILGTIGFIPTADHFVFMATRLLESHEIGRTRLMSLRIPRQRPDGRFNDGVVVGKHLKERGRPAHLLELYEKSGQDGHAP